MAFATLVYSFDKVEITELILDFVSKGDDFVHHFGWNQRLSRSIVGWFNYEPLIAHAFPMKLALAQVTPHLLLRTVQALRCLGDSNESIRIDHEVTIRRCCSVLQHHSHSIVPGGFEVMS